MHDHDFEPQQVLEIDVIINVACIRAVWQVAMEDVSNTQPYNKYAPTQQRLLAKQQLQTPSGWSLECNFGTALAASVMLVKCSLPLFTYLL